LPTHNANMYGQAANSLNLTPSQKKGEAKFTLTEKFLPLYDDQVQTEWMTFLGAMAGQDPRTYTGKRPSWKDGLDFIQTLKLFGVMGEGLTTLQLANNLAILGICDNPDASSMAAWISGLKELGAFKGLQVLGFNLRLSDPIATCAAFLCVYNHLDNHLTDKDKEELGFGAIFVEHALCKVQRWSLRYDTSMQQSSFNMLAAELTNLPPWVSGANATNGVHFPFPLGT
ncbi:hypothetical protein C8J57DRAFT_1030944, partial [Mycena rebaudengoi]